MICTHSRRVARGFSLLELLIVVVVTLAVAAIAIPQAIVATENFRLRGAADSFAGLAQKCRMLAVSLNNTNSITSDATGYTCKINDANPTSLALPSAIVADSTGGGFDTTSMNMTWTSSAVVGLPNFNSRGVPCVVSGGGPCSVTGQGYIYYLRQDRSVGSAGWAAITVTPFGRVQTWTWNGDAWE